MLPSHHWLRAKAAENGVYNSEQQRLHGKNIFSQLKTLR
jgi:hypothetical protein